jgi:Flp pilus assembly protein TadD
MAQDLNRLLEREQQLDQEKAEIAKGKTQLADEYVIKARLQAVAYNNPHWFEQACQYFEAALKAVRNPTTLFEYALFLQNHNCFDQAKPLYQEYLDQRRTLAAENPRTYLPDVAMTLNNLAILQKAQNDFETARGSYEEALQIRRTLAAENPRTYLPYVAMTLNNLAFCNRIKMTSRPPAAAMKKRLQMYRTLAAENPRTYLPDVAMTLNNLAILQQAQNDFETARQL